MKTKILFAMASLILMAAAMGCTTYQERIIDEGTVVEQRTIVE